MNTLSEKKRQSLIRTAGIIALIGNLALAVMKLFMGYFGNSLAVLGDGIDSATDVCIALMTLFVSAIISRPSDREHPWGHGRAETTATMVLSFIILFAGAQLALTSIKALISGTTENQPGFMAIIASCISITGKIALAFSQSILGKKANSSMIKANAANMKNDIIMSLSVLAGISASAFFKMPVLDPIAALLVSLWVIKNAIKLFLEMNTELMDGNTNPELYEELFSAIKTVPGATKPHRARIRKIASRWDIDLDIDVNAEMTVHDAHDIAEQVELAIRNKIPDVYDIMVHIEPAGHDDHHPVEQYGLNEDDMAAIEGQKKL